MPTPVPPIPVVLCLGTAGCHLCELAEEMILAVFAANPGLDGRVAVECVDIIESSALVDRFGIRIPVLLAPFVPSRDDALCRAISGVVSGRIDDTPMDGMVGEELAWPFTPEDLVEFFYRCVRAA